MRSRPEGFPTWQDFPQHQSAAESYCERVQPETASSATAPENRGKGKKTPEEKEIRGDIDKIRDRIVKIKLLLREIIIRKDRVSSPPEQACGADPLPTPSKLRIQTHITSSAKN